MLDDCVFESFPDIAKSLPGIGNDLIVNDRNEGIVYITDTIITGNKCFSSLLFSDLVMLCRLYVIGFDTARYLSNASIIVM